MAHTHDRTAAEDNSWGKGNYPLPPQLSHLGNFASALAPTKLLRHNYFVQDQTHMLTVKVNDQLSVMGNDMRTLLRLGLTRIQSNSPGTLAFYFEGYPVEPKTAAARVASRFLASRSGHESRLAASYNLGRRNGAPQ